MPIAQTPYQTLEEADRPLTEAGKRTAKVVDTTYRNNKNSDYTERIKQLQKKFDYNSNRDRLWSEPEFSILYGTPLYEAASESQKLALNHLYWIIFYYGTASSETNTILFNQITAGVFAAAGNYETLCLELDLETDQEREHIRAFQKIGRETSMTLLGTKVFSRFLKQKDVAGEARSRKGRQGNLWKGDLARSPFASSQERALRFVAKMMFKGQERFYSRYFLELEQQGKPISVPTSGWSRLFLGSEPLLEFFTVCFGSTPLLASYFYLWRYMANVLTKIQEHRHSLYFQYLQKQGEEIPAPTAIARYHFLDESFHVTTSQTLARDAYKEFPQPTVAEKFLVNIMTYLLQRGINLVSGLASGLHGNYFGNDRLFMLFVYRLLQTPSFGLSAPDALNWMERSLCREHEGFYLTFKKHQRLASSMRQLTSELDYLWPVNREMRLLDSISIDKAIQSNVRTFARFSNSVASSLE